LTTVYAGSQTFLNERTAFLREHHNGMYCVSVYYLCRMLAEVSNRTLLSFFRLKYASIQKSKTDILWYRRGTVKGSMSIAAQQYKKSHLKRQAIGE